MRRAVFFTLFAAVLGMASAASAWEGLTSLNPTWSGPVIYSLNSAGSADLGGFDATEPIVRQGMDDWTRVSCSGLTTDYGGSTTSPPGTRNTIAWREGSWGHDTNAIGVTTPRFSGSDLIDAAMEMNGVNFTWTTSPGSGSQVNAYSIVLHEGGHYHGLGHSNDSGATMFFAYSGGVSSLNADDEAGICALYPGGDGGTTDCTTTGCPTGQVCDGGTCVDETPTGTGATCEPCTSDTACDGLCLLYPDGNGYCGDGCSTDADCGGSNETCEPVSDGSQRCIRRRPTDDAATCAVDPGTTEPEPEPDPEPDPSAGGECTTSRDCDSSELCNADAQCVPVPST
nr:matrixin family metalloprotease [Actinomycetota bacterium]NIU64914.1 matrixin family metalloprotease [Actinomycetota bacterium]NIW26726.1 matrixin family metalloprotease [Actinomycetota bacterium]NIX19269.1 matrixin family metalloprotease [Actinomycetota bacterium]